MKPVCLLRNTRPRVSSTHLCGLTALSPLAEPVRLVARGVELVRDPIHPEVDVVGGVAAELLAVVDGPAAREEAAPRGGAVPVGVCAARKGAGQRSAGQREASGAGLGGCAQWLVRTMPSLASAVMFFVQAAAAGLWIPVSS